MKISIHHVAIICSDIERSKRFYMEVLGCALLAEHYREARASWKVDLLINTHEQIELFSFPNSPARATRPEACGLRHLAFQVENMDEVLSHLQKHHVVAEPVRIDEYTGKRFTFVRDPDDLPIEFYER